MGTALHPSLTTCLLILYFITLDTNHATETDPTNGVHPIEEDHTTAMGLQGRGLLLLGPAPFAQGTLLQNTSIANKTLGHLFLVPKPDPIIERCHFDLCHWAALSSLDFTIVLNNLLLKMKAFMASSSFMACPRHLTLFPSLDFCTFPLCSPVYHPTSNLRSAKMLLSTLHSYISAKC